MIAITKRLADRNSRKAEANRMPGVDLRIERARCACVSPAYPGPRKIGRVERMILGRLIGWIVFLAGAAVLVRDFLVWVDTKTWAPIALGQLWYQLNRSSLNLVQAVIQRYIHPFLWDPIIVSVLLSWAFAVLMILGALLLVVFRRRNARR